MEFLIKEETKNEIIEFNIQDYRLVIEHRILPDWFLYEQDLSVMNEILKEPGKLFIDLYNKLNQIKFNYLCPYSVEQFSTKIMILENAYNNIYVVGIIMPRPEKTSHCYEVLLVHDKNFKMRRYISIERDEDSFFRPERSVIGEWKADGEHIFYPTHYKMPPALLAIVGAERYSSDIEISKYHLITEKYENILFRNGVLCH